jgi:hypothetical protein
MALLLPAHLAEAALSLTLQQVCKPQQLILHRCKRLTQR